MAGKAAPSYRWYDTPALVLTVLGGVGVGVGVGTGVGVGAGGGVGVAPPLPHMQGHICGTPP